MRSVRVLIADDSVVYRTQIKAALSNLNWVEVVGAASNGKIAIERLQQIQVDLLVLDLEMPELNGIDTLKEIAAKNLKCKVLVFSSSSKRGAEITFEALRLGAHDFIAKPGPVNGDTSLGLNSQPSEMIRAILEPKIRGLFPEVETISLEHVNKVATSENRENTKYLQVNWDLFRPQILLIASSTGGPSTLEKIFAELAPPLSCPILITQHMPPIFTATLAERIQKLSGIPAKEGVHGETLVPNCIYFAPGNYHMSITGTKDRACIVLDQGPLQNSVRPAADPMFDSAVRIFRDRCLGIVLTGMGADGQLGAESIKRANGVVLIQSQESCIVFGMPGAVKSVGAYDRILSPVEIVGALKEKVAPFEKVHMPMASSGGN